MSAAIDETGRELRTVDVSGFAPVASAPRGAAPHLGWVDVASLVVDDDYQRPIGERGRAAIRRIAADFDWALFSTIDVAPRKMADGTVRYCVVDGQHRVHAAALSGIGRVPCRIVSADRAGQARAFAGINGAVTAMTPWQVYKAALAAGEGWARGADAVARLSGCRLMTSNATARQKKPREIYAVGLMRAAVERGDIAREAAVTALSALSAARAGDNPLAWTNASLRPWLEAVAGLDEWLDGPRAVRALTRFLDADFDLVAAVGEIDGRWRAARRAGSPVASRTALAAGSIVQALDARFPDRMAFARAGE